MFKVRSDEPKYAFLQDKETKAKNRYGQDIELAHEGSPLREQSLNINGETEIGDNPNRYKQHGFYFNADNCIGCHACESACSEKNDNPAHIAFRSVGFVEGGTYPDYRRINISMACNHCDDPVCLKGCPTRAYTKFAEYGAVLQDPDICFGCGYCTWVCPYNAPQLDPVKGQVTKCNMCVDRLEVGLKPACVAACLGNALDFGVIENIPENREQAKAEIPGFPDTSITHPNIRFQQTRTTQREMTRTDSAPIKYHLDDKSGRFKAVVDEKLGHRKEWNLRKLLTSHESSHAIFTLSVQAALGAFLLLTLPSWFGSAEPTITKDSPAFGALLIVMIAACTTGLYKLNMHLGKPHRFYRGFNNLRLSPVSREIAGVSLFYGGLLGYALFSLFETPVCVWLTNISAAVGSLGGMAGLYYMYKLYRIKARPFWDHWQTGSAFVGSTLSLGALMVLAIYLAFEPAAVQSGMPIRMLAGLIAAGLALEAAGIVVHARDMKSRGNEGAASHYLQITHYGKAYIARNALLAASLLAALAIAAAGLPESHAAAAAGLLAAGMLVSAAFGRSLFYVLVIPTTMPGAFFWKNEGFVEHARKIGLAEMEQVGVVYERHHRFDVGELVKTLRETSIKEMVEHVKGIFASRP
ncbi:MAG: DmsC/YnfH family molybdoenzyme membrane anchor subunit [Gammaproteobacteria bacterium]